MLIFVGALYSMSRMGLAALMVSLLALAIRGMRNLAIAAAVLLAVFVSVPGTLLERLGKTGGPDPLTSEVRMEIWKDTLHMTADYRVFGSGLGTYASVFQKYSAPSPEYLIDFAHNDYLQVLAETGLIGFTLAAAAALTVLIAIVRAVIRGATAAQRLLAAGCLAALAALLLDSAVDFDFYIPANAMVAAWIAGIGTAMSYPPGRRKPVQVDESPTHSAMRSRSA
jgi:O-antigen ligase